MKTLMVISSYLTLVFLAYPTYALEQCTKSQIDQCYNGCPEKNREFCTFTCLNHKNCSLNHKS